MSTVADYVGRVYDVAAFRGQRSAGDVLLDQSLLDDDSGGAICTGAQKVAQWFVIELMTATGSIPYEPSRGTPFIAELARGQLRSELDVYQAFSLAVGIISTLAAKHTVAADPADERFTGAELLAVSLGPGAARLTIKVSTAAGDARKVILPIETTG